MQNSVWQFLGYNSSQIFLQILYSKNKQGDLCDGPVVKNLPCKKKKKKNLPCSAGDTGSIPDWGTKTLQASGNWAHTPRLLSLCAVTRESAHHNKRFRMRQQRFCVLQLRPDVAKYIFFFQKEILKKKSPGFGPVVNNLPAKAGDTGSIPGLGRSHMPQSE